MSARTKQEVSITQQRQLDSAIEAVEDVLQNLRKGSITVEENDQAITVHPGGDVELSIKAKNKGGLESLEFKFKWRPSTASRVLGEDGAQLLASSDESAPASNGKASNGQKSRKKR